MLPEGALIGQQFCVGPPTSSSTTCTRPRTGSVRNSQSLRGLPTLPTTRCSCVLISANSSVKRSPGETGGRKMRRSILQFAKRLWRSEDTSASTRRVLCTNCKTDPVTQSTLCKKCSRRSSVCSACYSKILSLHHTRLDRYGSVGDAPNFQCSDCTSPVDSITYITPHAIPTTPDKSTTLPSFDERRDLPRLGNPRLPLTFRASAPVSRSPVRTPETPTTPTTVHHKPINHVKPVVLTKNKSFSSSDSEYQSCSENIDPDSPFTPTPTPLTGNKTFILAPSHKAHFPDNSCVIVNKSRQETPKTVARPTPPVSMVTRSRMINLNRPAMIRTRAIDESDELNMVKRTSMGDNVVLKPDIILPSGIPNKSHPDKRKQINRKQEIAETEIKENLHQPVEFTRSYSESSKDRRLAAVKRCEQQGRPERHGSLSETRQLRKQFDPKTTPVKRSVRIVEDKNTQHSRPCSLEVEHVTVGEVTPTVYVKDKNDVIDESIQKSESVLKRSLSVSNSRLQRKISRKLANKERTGSTSDEQPPHFLRRNRSSSSVDKSSPPPDLAQMTNAGIALEDIQAFGSLYVERLESRMRNIASLKEIEKQHNISCRERLKTALDTHDQLAAGLEDIKQQLKECMEKYRYISETFV